MGVSRGGVVVASHGHCLSASREERSERGEASGLHFD